MRWLISQNEKIQIHLPVHDTDNVLSMTLVVYPGGQVQVKLPGVLLQVAIGLQPPLFTAHSSISVSYTHLTLPTIYSV